MSKPSPASWYEKSMFYVVEALAAVPPDATRAECDRVLREAYPFGVRKHWPYKAWRRACREALHSRGLFNAKARALKARRVDNAMSAQSSFELGAA